MRTLKALLALGILAGTLSSVAQAAITYEIRQGANDPITLEADREVLLLIPNPNHQAMKLVIPELGVVHEIAMTPQDTYYIDGRKIPHKHLSYTLKTADNQDIASGKIVNTGAYSSTISLREIINYSTAYTAPEKPAPTYYEHHSATRYETRQPQSASTEPQAEEVDVRGYW